MAKPLLTVYAGDSDLFQVDASYIDGWQRFKSMLERGKWANRPLEPAISGHIPIAVYRFAAYADYGLKLHVFCIPLHSITQPGA
jgi:hypothetical protein